MSGLLIKDVCILKKSYKSVLPILLIYTVFQIMSPESSWISGMLIILGALASQSTFSFDETAKWDNYILAAPITRKEIIKSKYLFSIISLTAAYVIASVIGLVFHVGIARIPIIESLSVELMIFSVALLYLSIALPLFVKFGQERARIFVIAIIMLPMILFAVLGESGVFKNMLVITDQIMYQIILVLPFAAMLFFVISYYISVSIYQKKEL